jgi:[protein-PII] uridylyltransferase
MMHTATPPPFLTPIHQTFKTDLAVIGPEDRPRLIIAARHFISTARSALSDRFSADHRGLAFLHDMATATDLLIQTLASHILPPSPSFGLVATGGYGRSEMAPFSDIDLLILLPETDPDKTAENQASAFLYLLWDLGLKIGHAVRTVPDCLTAAAEDATILTSLLETRCLQGPALWADLQAGIKSLLQSDGQPTAFIAAKFAERDIRHKSMNDSRYVLEPNVKDGKGGLRDLHLLGWFLRAKTYPAAPQAALRDILSTGELRRLHKAHDFLATVRCHLHLIAGRAEERLTFERQSLIADRMQYRTHHGLRPVERFMRHYFLTAKDIGSLSDLVLSGLASAMPQNKSPAGFVDGFAVSGPGPDACLMAATPDSFQTNPLDRMRIFLTSLNTQRRICPQTLASLTRTGAVGGRILRQVPDAASLFLRILTHSATTEPTAATVLRQMNETGILGGYIADFARVTGQMQYDMYHIFTVDEHTLNAVGFLHRLAASQMDDSFQGATDALRKLVSRRALFVAVFLHDIAKGRGGDHSVLGAEVAERLCPHLGLTAEETETVAWLVRHHLTLSMAAFKRDPDDPQTIRDMMQLVQSPERLRLLFVLTVVDIHAVGPGRWNNWKATLLDTLYQRTLDALTGGDDGTQLAERVTAAQTRLAPWLTDFTPADLEKFYALGPPGYWVSLPPEVLAAHARLVKDWTAGAKPFLISASDDAARAVTDITIYAPDHKGLFSELTGAMTLNGANIVEARIFTLANGMALDIFSVQTIQHRPLEGPEKVKRIGDSIGRILTGQQDIAAALQQNRPRLATGYRFAVTPRCLLDNRASADSTVIEVNGADRPGLLFDLTRTLAAQNTTITTARISTWGEKVVDVFYVKDNSTGQKLSPTRFDAVRDALLDALQGS